MTDYRCVECGFTGDDSKYFVFRPGGKDPLCMRCALRLYRPVVG